MTGVQTCALPILHDDTKTIVGTGLALYTQEPKLRDGSLIWEDGTATSLNDRILSTVADPFQSTGGLSHLVGNLGSGVMKVSAVAEDKRIVTAPARIFHDQDDVKAAFKAGELTEDVIVVIRFQGPQANGMPELHSLTPLLTIMQERGQKVALVTDGRMSGASGKVPSAIHISPEALAGGPLACLKDGDIIKVDAVNGTLDVLTEGALDRPKTIADMSANSFGTGRELFEIFRRNVGTAETGASVF